MKAQSLLAISFLCNFLFTVGCSNQWREGSSNVSSSQIDSYFSEMQQASGQAVGDSAISQAMELLESASTTVFFAEGKREDPEWPLAAAFAFNDVAPITDGQLTGAQSVSGVRVFFLDNTSSSERQNVLIVGIAASGAPQPANDSFDSGATPVPSTQFQYYGFSGSGIMQDDEFSVRMTSSSGHTDIVLRTTDVLEGEFDAVIQIQVYMVDDEGFEVYIGKFSTLVGVAD